MEQRIREQRIVEANKKNLVGKNGKIGTILMTMGQPIVSHLEGGGYVDTHYIDTNPPEEKDDPRNNIELMRDIPSMGTENYERPSGPEWSEMGDAGSYDTMVIGWHFDGLSRGMHMEIKYDDMISELSLHHKGYLSYKEIKGEIVCYVPGAEWEGWIDTLYKSAKEIRRRQQEEDFEKKVKEAEVNKSEWWRGIISRWGAE